MFHKRIRRLQSSKINKGFPSHLHQLRHRHMINNHGMKPTPPAPPPTFSSLMSQEDPINNNKSPPPPHPINNRIIIYRISLKSSKESIDGIDVLPLCIQI